MDASCSDVEEAEAEQLSRGHRNHDDDAEEEELAPRRYQKREEPLFERFYALRFGSLRFRLSSLLYLSRQFFFLVFSVPTLLMTAIGMGTWAAFFFNGVSADLPVSLLSAAVVIPVAFGVAFNASRRENFLRDLALIKSSSLSVYISCRDLPAPSQLHQKRLADVKNALSVLLLSIRQHFLHANQVSVCYSAFNDLEVKLTQLAQVEPGFALSAAYSRIQSSFRVLMESFERGLVLHQYRTPSALRAYAFVFLGLSSALFSPLSAKYSFEYGLWAGVYTTVLMNILFSALYVLLISEEDPMDGIGQDDLSLEQLSKHPVYMYR